MDTLRFLSIETAERWAERAAVSLEARELILSRVMRALLERGDDELASAIQAARLQSIGLDILADLLGDEVNIARFMNEKGY